MFQKTLESCESSLLVNTPPLLGVWYSFSLILEAGEKRVDGRCGWVLWFEATEIMNVMCNECTMCRWVSLSCSFAEVISQIRILLILWQDDKIHDSIPNSQFYHTSITILWCYQWYLWSKDTKEGQVVFFSGKTGAQSKNQFFPVLIRSE